MNKRLLLVEDEESLRKIIQLNLEMEDFEVVSVHDGVTALDKINSEHFDLLILDLMLPQLSGMDVLKNIRVKDQDIPVIIISAKDTSTDRIQGLKTGADDYLNKPFEIEELLLRIQKLLERKSKDALKSDLDVVHFGDCCINFKSFSGKKAEVEFSLSQKETHILKFLINNSHAVQSRQDILKAVWGYDVYPSTRTIDNFIAVLRKRFEDDPKNPRHIKSIHGVGYQFVD